MVLRRAPAQATAQQQIDGILAKNPDAAQTGKSTVTLDKGAVTLRLAGATGLDACGAGLFCLNHADYAVPSGRQLSCRPDGTVASHWECHWIVQSWLFWFASAHWSIAAPLLVELL
ncbi:hypothetical protein [Streptomyces europaeiscabiei]|uniref:hypothetical protein n=1 Tax=Streptomyces europaeiscabiei TaxID=146819 RepID=UPI002E2C206E|nr:hypothetical protein [Streptomyces europaeiscabiei]